MANIQKRIGAVKIKDEIFKFEIVQSKERKYDTLLIIFAKGQYWPIVKFNNTFYCISGNDGRPCVALHIGLSHPDWYARGSRWRAQAMLQLYEHIEDAEQRKIRLYDEISDMYNEIIDIRIKDKMNRNNENIEDAEVIEIETIKKEDN